MKAEFLIHKSPVKMPKGFDVEVVRWTYQFEIRFGNIVLFSGWLSADTEDEIDRKADKVRKAFADYDGSVTQRREESEFKSPQMSEEDPKEKKGRRRAPAKKRKGNAKSGKG